MAKNERIDDIIAERAFKQVQDMTAKLEVLGRQLETVASNALSFTKTLEQGGVSASAKNMKLLSDDTAKVKVQTQLANQEKMKTAKLANDEISYLTKLGIVYKDATNHASNMAKVHGLASKEYEITNKRAADLKKTIDGLKQATGDHTGFVGKYANAIKGLGGQLLAITGLTGGVAMVFSFLKSSFDLWQEDAKQERLLLNALNNRIGAQSILIAQAKTLAVTMGIDDKDIMEVQTMAAAHGQTTKEIKNATTAAINYSRVMGVDLHAAAIAVMQTYEGQVGRLGRLDDEFKKLTSTQLENGGAIDLLNTKYKGFGEASASSVNKLKVAWEEFRKGFFETRAGEAINGIMDDLAEGLRMGFKGQKEFTDEEIRSNYQKMTALELDKALKDNNVLLLRAAKEKNQKDWEFYLNFKKIGEEVQKQNQGLDKQDTKEKALRVEKLTALKAEISKTKDLIALKEKYEGDEQSIKLIDKEIKVREKDVKSLQDQAKAYEELNKAWGDYLNNRQTGPREMTPAEQLGIDPEIVKGKIRQIHDLTNSMVLRPEQVFPLPTDQMSQEWEKFYKELQGMAIETLGTGISDQINASFEDRITSMNDQLDAWHQSELDRIERQKEAGLLSDKEYNSEKDKIDKEYAAKQKANKIREAQIKKQEALWEIAIQTAVAIMKAAPNPVMMATAAAMGIAEAAIVAARPIPKYAKGRKGGKEEIAMVGEAGPEVVQYGSNAQLFDRPSVVKLPAGADVLPMKEIMDLTQRVAFSNVPAFSLMSQQLKFDTDKMTERIVDAIKNKREVIINMDNEGLKTFTNNGRAYQRYLDRNVRL